MKWKERYPACCGPASQITAALRYGLKTNVLRQITLISAQHKYKRIKLKILNTCKKNLDILKNTFRLSILKMVNESQNNVFEIHEDITFRNSIYNGCCVPFIIISLFMTIFFFKKKQTTKEKSKATLTQNIEPSGKLPNK